jgi:hypothetical protein
MSDNPIVQGRLETIAFNHAVFLRAVGEDLTPEQATRPVMEGGSHVLWLVGHMAWAYDVILRSGLNGEPSLIPAEWPALFGFGSKPTSDPARYPSLAETLAGLKTAYDAAMAYLATIPDADLPQPLPARYIGKRKFRTWSGLLQTSCFHEAYHCGQVGMLRRGLGLGSGIG